MKLAVKIIRQVDSYEAWCPALPGCRVTAASKEQACERIQTAVQGYLASLDVALPRELGSMLNMEAACVAV